MRVALYGNFMFQLATGLREVSDFDIQIFINEPTIPHCLADEPGLADPDFAQVGSWESGREILRPGSAGLTERLREFDVALTTAPGPIATSSPRTTLGSICAAGAQPLGARSGG